MKDLLMRSRSICFSNCLSWACPANIKAWFPIFSIFWVLWSSWTLRWVLGLWNRTCIICFSCPPFAVFLLSHRIVAVQHYNQSKKMMMEASQIYPYWFSHQEFDLRLVPAEEGTDNVHLTRLLLVVVSNEVKAAEIEISCDGGYWRYDITLLFDYILYRQDQMLQQQLATCFSAAVIMGSWRIIGKHIARLTSEKQKKCCMWCFVCEDSASWIQRFSKALRRTGAYHHNNNNNKIQECH